MSCSEWRVVEAKLKYYGMRVTSWKVLLTLATLVAVVAEDTADDHEHEHEHEHEQGVGGDSQSSSSDGGRIVQSLFRFPATQLGPEFGELLQMWHSEWLHADNADNDTGSTQTQHLPKITPESSGAAHAFYSVATPAATLFRRQCYSPAPIETQAKHNLYKNFEQQRKAISFQYIKDSVEEMKLIHTMTKRFYPAFTMHLGNNDKQQGSRSSSSSSDNGIAVASTTRRMHKKKSKSTVDTIYAQTTLPSDYDSPSKLAFQTVASNSDKDNSNNKQTIQQEWAWHPPAHFSSRGVPNNMSFRVNMYKSMRNALQTKIQQVVVSLSDFEFDHGRQSGMFWYPPGGVREWHRNYLDLVGNTKNQKQKKRDNGSSTAAEKTKEEEIFASQVSTI